MIGEPRANDDQCDFKPKLDLVVKTTLKDQLFGSQVFILLPNKETSSLFMKNLFAIPSEVWSQ